MVSRISNYSIAEIRFLGTPATQNAISYLERLEPGINPNNVHFPLVFGASGGSQPGRAPLKISTDSAPSLRMKLLIRRTVPATPDA